MNNRIKIFRITTVASSLNTFLKGFLNALTKNYEVFAVSSPNNVLNELGKREHVKTIGIPMERHIAPIKDLISLFRLITLFYREKPEIVHSMTPKAGLLTMIAAWITRVPIRIHTFTGLIFPTSHGLKRKVLMITDAITCACATYINPEGLGVKNDLQRFHITKKPLHIIANGNVRGADMSYYARTPEVIQMSKKYHQNSTFTFCFIGRIVRDKGINELIVAYCKLQKEFSNIRLILIGPFENNLDPISPETETIITKQTNNILFYGKQKDVRPFLTASDAFVFPSYREGFPNTVLEAGALGIPSIVTDINGCNEIIVQNKNGIIIPSHDENALYDAMKYFIENPEEVKRMGENARPMIASRYEQKMIWNTLLEEYKRLCTEKGIL